MFEPHLSFQAKYILANGSGIGTGKSRKRNVFHYPNKEERLEELKKLKSYGMNNRRDYVKKQGWATMSGEKESDSRVAGKVADLPAKLI